AGVDVELRHGLWRYVRSLRDRGTTVVLTTHYLEEAEELADRIGVIDRGRLLLVEEKDALLQRHGAKTLRLVPARRLSAVPPPLAALGARLEEDGAAVSVEVPAGGTFGPFLAAAAAAGVAVKDLETRRTTLEDVFVRLVGGGAAAARAASPEDA
ncbi:MAG TPA: ABC transporter ATP-binding protein, partial [Myxococcales bacterium]|nr:ABC transporter ATP-binding protein [Myxococcales bacterium]